LTLKNNFLLNLIQRVCFPNGRLSYSQVGEDRILAHFFKGLAIGYYVDVGCNHPIVYSNTWLLYRQGWHGLVIDPQPQFEKLFKKKRPRDIFFNGAIDVDSGEKNFIISRDSRESGLEQKDHALANQPEIISKTFVKTKPLTQLFKRYNTPTNFEFLNIDVEGHELSVLKSLDLNTYRPKLILVEIHNFRFDDPHNQIVVYMKKWGYHLSSYAVMNGYFVET
jgi:FkbM family methyltransferase